MKRIFVVIEEWNNCADYREDLESIYTILCSTNSFKMAEKAVFDRQKVVISYLDSKYLDETGLKIEYTINKYKSECKLMEDDHTYCGDSFVWRIVSTELIEG